MIDGTNGDGTTYIEMNNTNTNVTWAAGSTEAVEHKWSSSVIGAAKDYVNPKIITSIKNNVISNATLDGEDGWKYGVLYNYAAASAGTITGSSNAVNATQDICPKGWRLPTGGSSGEYQTFTSKYTNNATSVRNALRLPFSGYFGNGSLDGQGSRGSFWASTMSSSSNMYALNVDTSSVNPINSTDRFYGFSVRCIAQPLMQDVGTWGSAFTSGKTMVVADARDGKTYMVGRFGDGKIWMMDNLAFTGQDASGNYIEMNNTNTNVPWAAGSTDAITWSNDGSNGRKNVVWSSQSNTYTAPLLQDNSAKPTSGDAYISGTDTTSWKYGVHYNYCAATVEQDGMCKSSQSSNATQSVCPAGWRLPTGGSGGEFATIYGKYNAYKSFREALRLPLSGYVNDGTLGGGGSYGYFWSSVYNVSYSMYDLRLDLSSVYTTDYSSRFTGYSVRCIAP